MTGSHALRNGSAIAVRARRQPAAKLSNGKASGFVFIPPSRSAAAVAAANQRLRECLRTWIGPITTIAASYASMQSSIGSAGRKRAGELGRSRDCDGGPLDSELLAPQMLVTRH